MLITLLAWLYISFLCWTWGKFSISALQKITDDVFDLHFSFICLTGLSVITVIAATLSLFIPLGSWWVQLIFLVPSFLYLFQTKYQNFFSAIKKIFSELHITSLLLLFSLLLMILVMSTWTIVHPDTLGYHAQTIQWIEKYKAVPGLVNLHVRFGYQGLWFVPEALFGFNFTGIDGITFLNSTVLMWFFVFVICRINSYFFKEKNKLPGWGWTGLLIIACWSYTQVRLTATSASPDFIATLFIWAIVWLVLEQFSHLSDSRWMLVIFFSLIAVTIKLSVVPVLILVAGAGVIFFIQKKIRPIIYLSLLTAITFFPFIARNIISSGYALFPVPGSGVIKTDWKYSEQTTIHEKNYINAYAKFPGISRNADLAKAAYSKPPDWLRGWWKQKSTADKTILILLLISFMAVLIFIRKIFHSGIAVLLLLFTLFSGIIFWFIQAPDPRFGFGQIIGLIGVIFYLCLKDQEWHTPRFITTFLLIGTFAIAASYCGYRFKNFFTGSQWLKPLGIEKKEFSTVDCDGIKINIPLPGNDFGNIPVPCTDVGCDAFVPRGEKITDGFRAKEIR